ncbi:MAG: GNAT family N-acetyltransferase [Candidatus Limnocylindria bacterium]
MTTGGVANIVHNERMTDADALEILPLTPERLPDLASLFGQGGDPKRCWCSFFRLRNADVVGATAETNRKVLERAVEVTTTEGRAPGLVAYRDGEPIGWVSLGPRDDYQRLQHSKVLAPLDEQPVWSIVCFVVSRRARKQGVANVLLEVAIAYAAEHGATLLEAYPVDTHGGRIPSANVYKGTLAMFRRAGFSVVAERQFNRTTPVHQIVRREV